MSSLGRRPEGESRSVPSPCVNVCQMDAASGWCIGCLRSLDEIATWSRMGDGQKRAVWAQLADRRASPAAPPPLSGAA